MSAKVQRLKVVSSNPMPVDFPQHLRDLAVAVETGRVRSAIVCVETRDGSIDFYLPSMPRDSLALATIIQNHVARKFTGP